MCYLLVVVVVHKLKFLRDMFHLQENEIRELQLQSVIIFTILREETTSANIVMNPKKINHENLLS